MAAQDRTGHNAGSPVRCIVTVSCLSSDFWNSKVMEIVSESAMFLSASVRTFPLV